MSSVKSSPGVLVVLYLSMDIHEPTDGNIGFSTDGDGCSNDGPDLWISVEEWEELGMPEFVKVTVEVDGSSVPR